MNEAYLSWSTLLRTLEGPYLLLEEGGHIVESSMAARSELGYSREELGELTIFEINPRINMLEWQRRWREMKEGKLKKVETVHLSAKRQFVPVWVRACVLNIGGDERCLYLFSNQSSAQPLQELLDESGELLRAVFVNWDLVTDQVAFFGCRHSWWGGADSFPERSKYLVHFMRRQVGAKQGLNLVRRMRDAFEKRSGFEDVLQVKTNLGEKTMKLHVRPKFGDGRLRSWLFLLADQEVLRSEGSYADLYLSGLDHTVEGVALINAKGYHLYHNNALLRMMESAGISNNLIHSVSAEALKDWATFWKEGKAAKKQVKVEGILQRAERSPLPVRIKLKWLADGGDEMAFMFVQSLANQRQREHELEEALEQVRDLKKRVEDEKSYLKEEIDLQYNFRNIITRSDRYKFVLKKVEQVASTSATVLILGETGTGKELLARAIHSYSKRKDQPLVKLNCSVLPEHLVESELFGHERGAFTGAIERKIGRFELADSGTLFLDEVGELPLELQTKLLRVLQEGEFERVGNSKTMKVDVRVVAATNRNLDKLVEQGLFREDLYYRLNVFPIYNIPLRDRPEDIPALVRHFLDKYAGRVGKKFDKIPKGGLRELQKYSFPGNIRELENMIERAMILSDGDKLRLDLVLPGSNGQKEKGGEGDGEFPTFEEMQREHIVQALKKTKWRVSGDLGAARILDLNPKTLYSKMRKLGIRREDYVNL